MLIPAQTYYIFGYILIPFNYIYSRLKLSDTDEESTTRSKPGIARIIQSTLAAVIGIQTNKNREKDFKNGNIWVFVVSGIVFTVLFIATVMTVVRFALSSAG